MKVLRIKLRTSLLKYLLLSLAILLSSCMVLPNIEKGIQKKKKLKKIDAAFTHSNGAIYFFSGVNYIKWEPGKGVVKTKDNRTKRVTAKDGWKMVYWPFNVSLNAAINYKKKAYFINGNQFIEYKSSSKSIKQYKLGKSKFLRGLDYNFSKGIDAIIQHPKSKLFYAFKGNQYYCFKDNGILPPVKFDSGIIGVNAWKSLPKFFRTNIDAALVHPKSKNIYFFKGDKYTVWKPGKGVVNPAIRKRNIDGWRGVVF
ncbi:hemopexin repeat-containing protein [Polaribacter aquimarinus]|uniref:Uncharacterized protein n=1 Tax=Polaribacter aquimarinus TaxID=2100726 RepID=A0A2U2JDD6_9FLAO|nr:hemopexin repeat-containing protein [Polaribacter aquimarinus]PWG06360.1 hypothetical protein DIS07_00580 [Polaribacter aquimarinus]